MDDKAVSRLLEGFLLTNGRFGLMCDVSRDCDCGYLISKGWYLNFVL